MAKDYKGELMMMLKSLSQQYRIKLETEYLGLRPRLYRFDYAFPRYKIAIEYEGMSFGKAKSRHQMIGGFIKDSEKYNLAVIKGWRILRYTAPTISKAYEDVKSLLERESKNVK